MPLAINDNAAKYLAGGSVRIGVTDKNTATIRHSIGIIVGTRYGRGRSGCVLRKTNKQTNAEP